MTPNEQLREIIWQHVAPTLTANQALLCLEKLEEQLAAVHAALIDIRDCTENECAVCHEDAARVLFASKPASESVFKRKAREQRKSLRGSPPSVLPDPGIDLRGTSNPAKEPCGACPPCLNGVESECSA